MFPLAGSRVFVAGETGMVGRAIVRALEARGDVVLLSAPHSALDLTDQRAALGWLAAEKPDAVFLTAGCVGGIGANVSYPADFIRDNLAIAQNVIDGAHKAGVQRLVYFGSSCIYPRDAAQPIVEEALLTGSLEPTNEAYAIAKIAGIKLCQFYRRQYGRRYISVMPTNLYGPYDRYDAERSHVIPAMMMKFADAVKTGADSVTLWGTGAPLREFLHVDDLARAALFICERYDGESHINIGSGEEVSIAALARMIANIAGFQGRVDFDASKPDGAARKRLDCTRLSAMGWQAETDLEKGLLETYIQAKKCLSRNNLI
ncbi:MAG: GDP-fucose synthetase [Micavibrio aeruginosavorus]|uniref:GDP-L-fucose synthase n=1 Tax=Micavibrio aeruginosavorus TaxID=349221 RepID=A0A2W4ZY24_9BACT|nr:MAG: GDP-fucose synthetase [Micavibrio aeruginosavorus]